MSGGRTILVTGATRQQGGAAARYLLASGRQVRALTRDATKPAAQLLAALGIELVQGDLADRAVVKQAVRDVYGVFSVQNPQEHGPVAEMKQGIALADAASAAEDIGAFVALAFNHPDQYIGQAFELAGDELTPPKIAQVFERVMDRPVAFVEQPIEQLQSFAPEMALMFEWFNTKRNQADIPMLRTLHPQLKPLEAWLLANEWAVVGAQSGHATTRLSA